MTDAIHPTEHQVGEAFVTIDVNELNSAGPGIREVIFRVRRASNVDVYRLHVEDEHLPRKGGYDTKQYLLSLTHDRPPLFSYRKASAVRK